MTKDQFVETYRTQLKTRYSTFASKVAALLGELVADRDVPLAQLEDRAKTPESLAEKIERKAIVDPQSEIKDLAGVRLITYYHDDVDSVVELVREEFEIDEEHSEDKLQLLRVDEFGYRSVHLVCRLAESRRLLPEWASFADLWVEVQIRSVLQHAWAAISHKLDYKEASEAPAEIRRQLFRLSALLELADIEFTNLRERVFDIVSKYRTDVRRGDLQVGLDLDSLNQYLDERFDHEFWNQRGIEAGMRETDIPRGNEKNRRRLLKMLQTIGIESLAEFDTLIQEIRVGTKERLQHVAQATDGHIYAVSIDVVAILAAMARADLIPPDFDWDRAFGFERQVNEILSSLRTNA